MSDRPEPPFTDFVDSPDEPMFAKLAAFEGRANAARQVRARIVARHSLRREPTRAELDTYAQRLYERTDTTLDVSGIPEAELRAYYETDEELRRLSGPLTRVSQRPPTAGEGLTRERIVRKVAELRRQHGTWPTEPATAEALEIGERRIRQVYGPRKWAGIIADAADLLGPGG